MFKLSRRDLIAGMLTTTAAAATLDPKVATAAPRAQLIDERWTRFGSASDPDHSAWARFLSAYRVAGGDGIARLGYGDVSAADRAALDAYIASLEAAVPSEMKRDAAFAYWANLYNAVTVKLVLEAYPVSSIKEVRGGLFNTGPWRDEIVTVEGARLSLDDIEHGIMRPVFRDPRIHYAVNCAALGCPNLGPKPFTSAGLDATLNELAQDYVNHPRGARVENGRLTVSSIYDWFQADFGGNDAGVIAHLKQFADPDLAAALDGVTRIARDEYDWSLNVA